MHLIELPGYCSSAAKRKASQNPGTDDLRAMHQKHSPLENMNF